MSGLRTVDPSWRAAVLVCRNERPPGAEKPSCGAARGSALREWLKAQAREAGVGRQVIVLETSCLGVCSPLGVTVSVVPDPSSGLPRRSVLVPDDADRAQVWAEIAAALQGAP